MPLNFRGAYGSLVIGAVGIPLRLSALGLRGVSFLLTRTCAVLIDAMARHKTQIRLSL